MTRNARRTAAGAMRSERHRPFHSTTLFPGRATKRQHLLRKLWRKLLQVLVAVERAAVDLLAIAVEDAQLTPFPLRHEDQRVLVIDGDDLLTAVVFAYARQDASLARLRPRD